MLREAMQSNAIPMQCNLMQCNLMQCKLMHCNVVYCNGMQWNRIVMNWSVLSSSVLQCNVLVLNSIVQYIYHNLTTSKPLLLVDVLKSMDWNCQLEPQETVLYSWKECTPPKTNSEFASENRLGLKRKFHLPKKLSFSGFCCSFQSFSSPFWT